jgi:hypothetical protein
MTLIFNLTEVEDTQLPGGRSKIGAKHFRVRNVSPKFKSINFPHKDKINAKMFATVFE